MPQTSQTSERDVKIAILHKVMQNTLHTMSVSVRTAFKVIICGKVSKCHPVNNSYYCGMTEGKDIFGVKDRATACSSVHFLVRWNDVIYHAKLNWRYGKSMLKIYIESERLDSQYLHFFKLEKLRNARALQLRIGINLEFFYHQKRRYAVEDELDKLHMAKQRILCVQRGNTSSISYCRFKKSFQKHWKNAPWYTCHCVRDTYVLRETNENEWN